MKTTWGVPSRQGWRSAYAQRNFSVGHLLFRFLPAEARWLVAPKMPFERSALCYAYGSAFTRIPATVLQRARWWLER